jgi:hypothetical protein
MGFSYMQVVIPFHISNVRHYFCKYQKNNMFAGRSLAKITGNGIILIHISQQMRQLRGTPQRMA